MVRDFKKYTNKQFISAIEGNQKESRKEWMLNMFRFIGGNNKNNKTYQFWK